MISAHQRITDTIQNIDHRLEVYSYVIQKTNTKRDFRIGQEPSGTNRIQTTKYKMYFRKGIAKKLGISDEELNDYCNVEIE